MKTNNEIFDIVMKRKDEYYAQRAVRNKRIGAISAAVLALAVCVTAGVASQRRNGFPVAQGSENGAGYESAELSLTDDYEEQTAVSCASDSSLPDEQSVSSNKNGESTTQKIYGGAEISNDYSDYNQTKPVTQDKDSGGGEYGGAMIPATPDATGAKPGVKVTGERITDEEAKAYFEKNTWIVSALSSSGVPADNLKFSDKGYCHVSYDGTDGKQLEVRQNFRDYLVWNNGKLVAIVTLTKENGEISANPAFGGPHYDDYNAFLQKHKGEKLLFVYAGWMELVITPDGECVNPQGYDMSGYLEGLDNPYGYFYAEEATYTP